MFRHTVTKAATIREALGLEAVKKLFPAKKAATDKDLAPAKKSAPPKIVVPGKVDQGLAA